MRRRIRAPRTVPDRQAHTGALLDFTARGGDMQDVQISINEEGDLKVVRRYDIRFPPEWLRPQGSARHRVAAWPDCSRLRAVPEPAFIRALKVLFLGTVLWCLISQILIRRPHPYNPVTWLFGYFLMEGNGVAVLAVFAAVLVVGVLAKQTATRRRVVPVILGRVRQV